MLGFILNGVRVPGRSSRTVVYPPLVVSQDALLET
jgi:hypothetical protein